MHLSPKVYLKSKTIAFVSENLYEEDSRAFPAGSWYENAKRAIDLFIRQHGKGPNYLIFVCQDGDFRVRVADYKKRWQAIRSEQEAKKNGTQDFEDIASHARAITSIASKRCGSLRPDVVGVVESDNGARQSAGEGAVTGRTETVSRYETRNTEIRPASSVVGKTYSGSPVKNPHPVKIEISNAQPLAASYRSDQLSMYVNGKWVGWVSENDAFGLADHFLKVSSEMRVNREIKDAMTKRPPWGDVKLYPYQESAIKFLDQMGHAKYSAENWQGRTYSGDSVFRIEQNWHEGFPYISLVNRITGERVLGLSVAEAAELSIALRRANEGKWKGSLSGLSFAEKRNLGCRLYYAVEAFRAEHGKAFG